ncbi:MULTISPECIES: hypothetical protein [unclassified Nocardia]|uniref:hypothetical protein n=1 Tax=unclassified Nocardia TaxID=2637762 RepID=UPI001CE3FD1C|nr:MULTISPECIES: hypothetical protein [unclassified Nocardia]
MVPKSACGQRLTELDECIEWARGLFGDLGFAVKAYPDKLLTGLEPDVFDTVAGGKDLGDVGLDNQIAGLKAGDPEAGGEVGRRG